MTANGTLPSGDDPRRGAARRQAGPSARVAARPAHSPVKDAAAAPQRARATAPRALRSFSRLY